MTAAAQGKLPEMGAEATASGQLPNDLANAVSNAINAALSRGMEPDEAACIAIAVAADYGRSYYGDAYLPHLAKAVTSRAGLPEPETKGE